MVETKDKMFWSEMTDSHHEIIEEFNLCESGVRGVNVVPIEICPPDGDLSLPLSKWTYSVDYQEYSRDLPEWYDSERSEQRARAALKEWAKHRLKGWKVKEAFKPVNPLKIKADETLDKEGLLRVWASVRASVRASVWDSVGDSVWDSVGASVGDSVGDSVWASVWAYIGSLFHNIKTWKYTDRKNPWASLRKLWIGGYVPSFDGKTWRLHAGVKAKIVFEITAEELRKQG